MKRLMALLLTVCLLASPLSAGAADVKKASTEEVILGVIQLLCSGFANGTLGVTYDDADGYSMAFTLGEDAAGMPGGTLRLTEGGKSQLVGADGQGLIWSEGENVVGVGWETLLRAACTDENGVCWLPSFTDEDSAMFGLMGLQLVAQMADTVKVTETGNTLIIELDLGEFLDTLDKAVPAVLRSCEKQLDDFLARNPLVTYVLFGEEGLVTTEMLISGVWDYLNLDSLVEGELPLRLVIATDDETGDWTAKLDIANEATVNAESLSGRVVVTLTAEGESRVLFDTADLETVMAVVAEALYFMPKDAFDFQTADYGYVRVSLDVEKLLRSFFICLSGSVLANSEKVDVLIERYSWVLALLDDAFGALGGVVNGYTFALFLQDAVEMSRVYRSLENWWSRLSRNSEILYTLFGNCMPKICFELDLGTQPRLVAETNYVSAYLTGMGNQFSGVVHLRGRGSPVRRYDISGFVGDNGIEALITCDGVNNSREPDAYRLAGAYADNQTFECTLSARMNTRWTDLFVLRATAAGGVNAVLTDSQNTKVAELQADESGFLFRLNGYQTPSELRKLGMPQVSVDSFEAELRVMNNGGRIRISGDETYALEWTVSHVTKHVTLTAGSFTINGDVLDTEYVKICDVRYNDRETETKLTLEITPSTVELDAASLSPGSSKPLWSVNMRIDTLLPSLQFAANQDFELITVNYRPGAFVMQTENWYFGFSGSLEIVDVSEHYDNLNTTRVRWRFGRHSRLDTNVSECLVATNAPDAHTAVIDLISEGKTFSTLTVTDKPAAREALPVRWLTEAETREVIDSLLNPPLPADEEKIKPVG